MDTIRKLTPAECGSVFAILPITIEALAPVVLANKEKIQSVERKTFKYGATDRHQLDVYYPPSAPSTSCPVLFWAYGGGFVGGDRILASSHGLVYATIGAFFARKGFVVVIPDYRLAPAVQFPAQAEDIRDAMLWVIKNAEQVSTSGVALDTDNLIAMGHSAGAINIATLYTLPELLAGTDILKRTKALVLGAGTFAFKVEGVTSAMPTTIIDQYYGPVEQQEKSNPLELLTALPDELAKSLPPVLVVEAEKESGIIVQTGVLYRQLLERRTGRKVTRIVADGHNHISMNWVLCTGDGEEWGHEVAGWIKGALIA